MHSRIQHFYEIIQHADSLQHWPQRYDQLTPGQFNGYLQDFQLQGIRLFREIMSCGVAQHTHTPAQRINLLLPIRMTTESVRTSGRSILASGLNFLPYCDDFFFVTPPDTDYVVISLECDELDRILVAEDAELFYQRPKGYGLVLSQVGLRKAQSNLLRVMSEVNDTRFVSDIFSQHRVKDYVLSTLMDLIEREHPARLCGLGDSHLYIVKYCHERVLEQGYSDPLSILDLCRELKVPRRTLHYAFEKTVDASPLQYLRAVRLNAAQRSMAKGDLPTVAEAATRWGFSHMSYFSQVYKRLFGQLPSTLCSKH